MKDQVFVSYRVGDTDVEARLLREAINERFGSDTAYQFAATNVGGEDFPERLSLAISRARVIVALFGPSWEKQRGAASDWMKTELAEGLAAGVPVLPLLVRRDRPPDFARDEATLKLLSRMHFEQLSLASEGVVQLFRVLEGQFTVRREGTLAQRVLKGLPGKMYSLLLSPRRYFLAGGESYAERLFTAALLYSVAAIAIFGVIEFLDAESLRPIAFFHSVFGAVIAGLIASVFFFVGLTVLARGTRAVGPAERFVWATAMASNVLVWLSLPSLALAYFQTSPSGREFFDDVSAGHSSTGDFNAALGTAFDRMGDAGGTSPEVVLLTGLGVFLLSYLGYAQWVLRASWLWKRMLGQRLALTLLMMIFGLFAPLLYLALLATVVLGNPAMGT